MSWLVERLRSMTSNHMTNITDADSCSVLASSVEVFRRLLKSWFFTGQLAISMHLVFMTELTNAESDDKNE